MIYVFFKQNVTYKTFQGVSFNAIYDFSSKIEISNFNAFAFLDGPVPSPAIK